MGNGNRSQRTKRKLKMVIEMKKFKVFNPKLGLIDLDLYDYQQDLCDKLQKGQKIVLTPARQMGTSTTIMAYMAKTSLEIPNSKFLFVVNNGNHVGTRTKQFRDLLLNYENIKYRTGFVEFENGSIINIINANSSFREFIFEDYKIFMDNYRHFPPMFHSEFEPSIKQSEIQFIGDCSEEIEGYERIVWHYSLNQNNNNWDENWKEQTIKSIGINSFNLEYEVA